MSLGNARHVKVHFAYFLAAQSSATVPAAPQVVEDEQHMVRNNPEKLSALDTSIYMNDEREDKFASS